MINITKEFLKKDLNAVSIYGLLILTIFLISSMVFFVQAINKLESIRGEIFYSRCRQIEELDRTTKLLNDKLNSIDGELKIINRGVDILILKL